MKLFVLQEGLARQEHDHLAVLDLPGTDLGPLLGAGDLDLARRAGVRARVHQSNARLRSPVQRPGKICVVGMNYAVHAGEIELEPPSSPTFVWVPGSSICGPTDPVALTEGFEDRVDYEGELAVVIGRAATRVRASEAWASVAGLTVCNDLSRRTYMPTSIDDIRFELAINKGFDSFKPIGPCMVTADEFDPHVDLAIRTTVNGEIRQDGRTRDLIFSIPELIAEISRYCTLEPGDIITTGTPAGVGVLRGEFLRPGDVVEVSVERIGSIRNEIVAPTRPTSRPSALHG